MVYCPILVGLLLQVNMRTTSGCELAVSFFPMFAYNAAGGGGTGTAVEGEGDRWLIKFDAHSLQIPDIDYKSTKVLGIPIPWPLRIEIVPRKLEVGINMSLSWNFSRLLFNSIVTLGRVFQRCSLRSLVLCTLWQEQDLSDILYKYLYFW